MGMSNTGRFPQRAIVEYDDGIREVKRGFVFHLQNGKWVTDCIGMSHDEMFRWIIKMADKVKGNLKEGETI